MEVKKGIWINIDDVEEFREYQEDLLTAMKHQGFSEIGIPMKTREGLRPFGVLDDFLDIWHENGLKVFAWLVCLIDESVDETVLCRNSANEVIESYICPTKASQTKIIDWEGEKITYLESLKRTIKKPLPLLLQIVEVK